MRVAILRSAVAAAACWCAGASALEGQGVSVRSFLDRTVVGVNQAFVLSVEVTGAQQVQADPALPDLSEFALYLNSGSSRQVQIVNGRTSVSLVLQYRFQATKEGTFEIGPVSVPVDGATYTTDPLRIEVTAAPPARGGAGGAQPSRAGEAAVAPDDLFLTVTASKRRVVQNEPVVVEYKIYTRVSVGSYGITRAPATPGFWTEEVALPPSPAVTNEIVDGREYATATIKKLVVFPTAAGTQTIDPMTIEAQVRVRRRSLDPFDDFFSGSLLGRNVPTLVTSEPVTLDVLPLPAAGRPPDFGGLVGRLAVSASVDKRDVETNEALALRVRVEGEGNIRTLTAPEIDFPGDFEVYPPEVTAEIDPRGDGITGSKTFEYVLVPRAPGEREIPAIRVSYFDVSRGGYETAETAPLAVTVTGDPVGAPVVTRRGRGEIETLREDIRFIHIGEQRLRPRGRSPFGPPFWLTLFVPMLAVAGAWGARRHRDRLAGDVAYARHRRARRVAHKRLQAARGLSRPATHREFYAETARALHGFLADKLNVAEAGFVRDDVRKHLETRGVPDEAIGAYFECLDVCDRQRFAPSAAEEAEMRAFLETAEEAMSTLGEALR